MTEKRKQAGLPLVSKLIFYGFCGFFTEIVFTAIWYVVDRKYTRSWQLHGCTSLWSFPIYSLSILFLEKLAFHLEDRLVLPIRVFIYVVWTYIWEFSTGLVLTQFDACPWNYTEYTTYNIKGLITFDYAPLWVFGVLLCEKVVIKTALQLEYKEEMLDVVKTDVTPAKTEKKYD